MSWRLFSKLSAVTLSSLGGVSLYSHLNPNDSKLRTVFSDNFIVNTKPTTEWDNNWDHRAATSLVKPLPSGSSADKKIAHDEKLEKQTSKQIRHIILVRHGQYNLNGTTDKERILTDLGREQAKLTGKRLADLKIPIDDAVVSTMTRAQETGNLILEQIPHRDLIKVENEPLIEEGAPIEPGKSD
jgi:serine/threonine-protein phosphatase PGAM5